MTPSKSEPSPQTQRVRSKIVYYTVALLAWAMIWSGISKIAGVWSEPSDDVVLYCAHDLPFVEGLIADYGAETGGRVTLVADTEATKSLGLVRRIVAEADDPRADVFWNNELLGTLDLAEQGLLAPLDVPNAGRFPDQHRGEHWAGFGARARVWILSADDGGPASAPPRPLLPSGPDFCVADPLFGTTLTHAAVLWDRVGERRFVDWFESLPEVGTRVVPGNAATRDLVADGVCASGWTDTDDAFGAVDRGADVRTEPVRVDGRAILIPNTVALVKGGPNPEAARRLADWLLSEAVERRLAAGPARQIPLGRLDGDDPLPSEVERLRPLVDDSVDLRGLLPPRRAAVEYLSGR